MLSWCVGLCVMHWKHDRVMVACCFIQILAGVRVAHALFRTGSAQTVLLHPGQMIPVSASGLRQYAFRYSRGWRTAYGDADPAYRKEGHSLPGPAGRPVWPPWKWPFFSGRALLQNPPPAQWVTGRRVLVNSAGECFSRSTRTVYGYRYSDLNARILPRQ